MFKFSDISKNRMIGVHPELVLIFEESLRISPIDFGIPRDGGVRTAERQNAMYRDPLIKTKCDGYNPPSNHQIEDGKEHGEALDYYAYVDGSASWKKHHMAMVAGVTLSTAKRLKEEGKISIDIRWGGSYGSHTFDGWDMCHIEVVG